MKQSDFVKALVRCFIVAEVLLAILFIAHFAIVLYSPSASIRGLELVLSFLFALYGVYIIGNMFRSLS